MGLRPFGRQEFTIRVRTERRDDYEDGITCNQNRKIVKRKVDGGKITVALKEIFSILDPENERIENIEITSAG